MTNRAVVWNNTNDCRRAHTPLLLSFLNAMNDRGSLLLLVWLIVPCTNCWAFCWVGWPMSWRVWGTSTNRFILTQKDAVSRVCLLFSPPINLLSFLTSPLPLHFKATSTTPNNIDSVPYHHTVLTIPPSYNAQVKTSSERCVVVLYFVLFVLYIYYELGTARVHPQ